MNCLVSRSFTMGLEFFIIFLSLLPMLCESGVGKEIAYCTQGFMKKDSVHKKSKSGFTIPENLGYLTHGLHLMPEMKFDCSGEIKRVLLGAKLEKGNTSVYPELQIWREINQTENTMNNGQSHRSVVLLSSHTMKIQPWEFFSSTIYFYHRFADPISFSAGDFVGIYVPCDDSAVKLYYTLEMDSPQIFHDDEMSGPPSDNTTLCLNSLDVKDGRHLLLRPETNVNSMCISGFLDYGTVKTKTHYLNPVTYHGRQLRLFPELKFVCRGAVTKVLFGAHATVNSTGDWLPELQIWRSDNEDHYIRISSAYLSLHKTSTDNIHELYLNPPLQVEQEDFIGLFQPEVQSSLLAILYQKTSGPRNLLVASNIDPQQQPNAVSRVDDSDENDYPVITVDFTFINSATSSSYASISLSLKSGHEQESTAVTIIHSTSLPSNTQSPPPPPSIEPDSEPNLILVIIVSVVVATVIILILVIAILVTFMCVKNKQQKQPTLSTKVAVNDTNPNSIGSRNPMTMSYGYDECVELKRNFSYGVVSPKQLRNIATSPNPSYPSISSQDMSSPCDPTETSYETIQDNSQEYYYYSSMYSAGSLADSHKYY